MVWNELDATTLNLHFKDTIYDTGGMYTLHISLTLVKICLVNYSLSPCE